MCHPHAGAHLIVDVEESNTEDSGPSPLPILTSVRTVKVKRTAILWMRLKCLLPKNQLSDCIH